MKAASISDIKNELGNCSPARLGALCLQLAKYKKDNKEFLSYLLFEEDDRDAYIASVKKEIDEQFETINSSHLYFAKKTLRKILRVINKYSRYSGNKQTEIELRIFFCRQLKASGIPFRQNAVLNNIFEGQLKKIDAVLSALHEDLQHDYRKEIPR